MIVVCQLRGRPHYMYIPEYKTVIMRLLYHAASEVWAEGNASTQN